MNPQLHWTSLKTGDMNYCKKEHTFHVSWHTLTKSHHNSQFKIPQVWQGWSQQIQTSVKELNAYSTYEKETDTPQKTNGWNLRIRAPWKSGKSSSTPFDSLIFGGVCGVSQHYGPSYFLKHSHVELGAKQKTVQSMLNTTNYSTTH